MRCVKCEIEKPETEFYPMDRKCKPCRCEMVRENRRNNAEYYRQFDRSRNMRCDRAEARKSYLGTARGKLVKTRSNRNWRLRNPDKYKAQSAVGNAVRDGRLVRKPCEICGCTEVEAHHEDYTRPLDVRWLCEKHHKQAHGLMVSTN